MGIQVKKVVLQAGPLRSHCLFFIPAKIKFQALHLCTHGYTVDKSSILPWAIRTADMGLPTLLFDLPGHYLGCFDEVERFEDFTTYTPELFTTGLNFIKSEIPSLGSETTYFLSGHSLGALMATKALTLPEFEANKHNTHAILAGFGLSPTSGKHLFESSLFEKTMEVRAQLVSPALHPKTMLPWIRKQKEELKIKNHNFYFVCGEDDIVVGKNGAEHLVDLLKNQGNKVHLEKPSKLPHNQPDLATPFIAAFIRSVLEPKLHVL